jgi:hypothetical protein
MDLDWFYLSEVFLGAYRESIAPENAFGAFEIMLSEQIRILFRGGD